MICTVLVLWFATVAIAGVVIGSYDSESAWTMIVGIVAGTTVFLALVKGEYFKFKLPQQPVIRLKKSDQTHMRFTFSTNWKSLN